MNEVDVYSKLTDIFREVFDDETITINETTTAADIDGWDSLRHVILMGVIEKNFDINFSVEDMLGMRTVGDMATKIKEMSV